MKSETRWLLILALTATFAVGSQQAARVSAFVSPGVLPPPPRPTPPACAPDCRAEHHAAEPLGVVEVVLAWGGMKVINWLAVDYQAGPNESH